MAPSRQPLVVAISLIVLGAGWLLNNLAFAPGVNWVWTLGLGIIGIVIFALGGFNKFTAVVGPFLIAASGLSYFRQTGRLDSAYELPGLTLFLGVLILLSHATIIPPPPWLRSTNRPIDA